MATGILLTAVKALLNPYNGNHIAKLGEIGGGEIAALRLLLRMKLRIEGRKILHERPLISSSTLNPEILLRLPSNTFGFHYGQFMAFNGITADSRAPILHMRQHIASAPIEPAACEETSIDLIAYILLRYRQVHDFWHVLCGLPISILGELILKNFEFHQTQLPMTLLAALFGPFRLTSSKSLYRRGSLDMTHDGLLTSPLLSLSERKVYFEYGIPWALENGVKSRFLLSVPFEHYLHTDLIEFRKYLCLKPFPLTLEK